MKILSAITNTENYCFKLLKNKFNENFHYIQHKIISEKPKAFFWERIQLYVNKLKTFHEDEVVLIIDSYDCLPNNDISIFEENFKKTKKNIIFGVEQNCYPDSGLDQAFLNLKPSNAVSYCLNAGCSIGYAGFFIEIFEYILSRNYSNDHKDCHFLKNDDQYALQRYYLEFHKQKNIYLDYNEDFFVNLCNKNLFSAFKNYPVILHGNGSDGKIKLEKIYPYVFNPKVTILTRFRNGEEYIDEYFQSLKMQTEKSFEIILLNHKSTDKSVEKIKDRQKTMHNLFLYDIENFNDYWSFVKKANSNIILYVDIDDLLHEKYIEIVLNVFKEKQLDFLLTSSVNFDHKTRQIEKIFSLPNWSEEGFCSLSAYNMEKEFCGPGKGICFKKDFFEKFFADYRFLTTFTDDTEFVLRSELLGANFCLISNPIFFYRKNSTFSLCNDARNLYSTTYASWDENIKKIWKYLETEFNLDYISYVNKIYIPLKKNEEINFFLRNFGPQKYSIENFSSVECGESFNKFDFYISKEGFYCAKILEKKTNLVLESFERNFTIGNWFICASSYFSSYSDIIFELVDESKNEILTLIKKHNNNLFDCENSLIGDVFENFDFGKNPLFLSGAILEHFYYEVFNYDFCKVEENDVVVDLGSNFGVFSILALLNGAKEVHLMEPNLAIIEASKKILSYNNCKFYNNFIGEDLLNIFNKNQKLNINNFLNQFDKIDFLKVDIEGGEYELFQDISEENLSKIAKIAIEIHPEGKKNNFTVYNILEKLKRFGFSIKGKYVCMLDKESFIEKEFTDNCLVYAYKKK